MQVTCPLDSSANKDKPALIQREFDGVGFICANQLLSSSQIRAPLLTSCSQLTRMEFHINIVSLVSSTSHNHLVTNTCRLKIQDLVGTWKSSNQCSRLSTFQWTAIMWLDGSLCLTTCKHLQLTIIQNLVGEQSTFKLTLR